MNNAITYWGSCLDILKGNLSDSAYRTWFAPIVPLQFEDGVLVLQVSSQFVVQYIEENYIDLLRKTIFSVCGVGTRLEYRVLIAGAGSTIPSQGVAANNEVERVEAFTPAAPVVSDFDSQLNPRYTFRSFVDGDSNRLARAAGLTISGNPGKTVFNPLFIYGGSGVGKTHLVNAIGNEIRQAFPNKRVLYVSANTFQVQYMDAVVHNKINDFMHFYQTIDVLIVDDVQYWSDRKGTQDAFFFIFNHLHQIGKQLILTSDRSPLELKGLHERLITRFKWGLTAELKRPDFQLRKDILKSCIYRDGLDIPEAVVDYIAENVRENVRDLEGILASLLAYSTLTNAQIDMPLTEEVVNRSVRTQAMEMTMENIATAVCEHFNVPEKMLMSKSRKKEIALARQVAMYIAKKMTDKPLAEIGLNLGNRNHATVLHAIKTVNDQMEYDAMLRRSVHQIENALVR